MLKRNLRNANQSGEGGFAQEDGCTSRQVKCMVTSLKKVKISFLVFSLVSKLSIL